MKLNISDYHFQFKDPPLCLVLLFLTNVFLHVCIHKPTYQLKKVHNTTWRYVTMIWNHLSAAFFFKFIAYVNLLQY